MLRSKKAGRGENVMNRRLSDFLRQKLWILVGTAMVISFFINGALSLFFAIALLFLFYLDLL